MRKTFIYLMVLALCLLVACGKQSNRENKTGLKNEPFLNIDLLGTYGIIEGSNKEYTTADMEHMAKEANQKDYVAVVKNYIKDELKQEISFLDSVDGTYNPKRVVVGTTTGKSYIFILKKWYKYDGIWTITSHAPIEEGKAVAPQSTVEYNEVRISDITD